VRLSSLSIGCVLQMAHGALFTGCAAVPRAVAFCPAALLQRLVAKTAATFLLVDCTCICVFLSYHIHVKSFLLSLVSAGT